MKKILTILCLLCLTSGQLMAQKAAAKDRGLDGGKVSANSDVATTNWEVEVCRMSPEVRAEITQTMARLKGGSEDRNILMSLLSSGGSSLAANLVDVIVTETFNLIQYRKKQKQEWNRMIQNENVYFDSITYINGLRDFYSETSEYGALDPSGLNFDGIKIKGMRNGREVLYMSCSIDRSKLDHLFHHSKFNLVLDTLAFYPLNCHLPNLNANGIRLVGDSELVRPGEGGNGFSFKERDNLRVGIDFSLFSSWINEAVQVHKDVELGNFSFNIYIPDDDNAYIYSRREVLAEADRLGGEERNQFLKKNLISVEGDSFIVPRSFMPLPGGKPNWGTGEYNMVVKITEKCGFIPDSEKARNWKKDYNAMRKMQRRDNEVKEYFQTFWEQNGTKMMKSTYSTVLNTAVKNIPVLNGTVPGAGAAGKGGGK